MNLYISHMSAMRYWRQAEGTATGELSEVTSLSRAIISAKDARKLAPMEHGLIMTNSCPLDVLVGSTADRRYASDFCPHVWSSPINRRSFYRIAPHIYVSSPAFMFAQLASMYSFIELAQIGNELCGGYFLYATNGFDEREKCKQLVSRRLLASYVQGITGTPGIKKARRALRWVADNCRSPAETNSMLMLCLPRRNGGWYLRMPTVNKRILVGERMRSLVDGSFYTPDFLWERKVGDRVLRVTGEYDSHEHHDEELKAEKTRIRRNNMKAMGYLVTSINRSQLKSADAFKYPARQIARDLGVYRPDPSSEMLAKQDELLAFLRRENFR